MSGSRMSKTHSSRPKGKALDASSVCPLTVEMATLRQRLLDRRRPGAHVAIKRMEKLDHHLADLMASAANLNPVNPQDIDGIDPMVRRFVYLKTNDLLAKMVNIVHHVANVNHSLNLTENNTYLAPEHPDITRAYKAVCDGVSFSIQKEKMNCFRNNRQMVDKIDDMANKYLSGGMLIF